MLQIVLLTRWFFEITLTLLCSLGDILLCGLLDVAYAGGRSSLYLGRTKFLGEYRAPLGSRFLSIVLVGVAVPFAG